MKKTITALLICPIVVLTILVACSHGSARTTTLRVAYVSVQTAADSLDTIEHIRTEAIIHTPGMTATVAQEQVSTWRGKVDSARNAVHAAMTVIAAAAGLNDDVSAALIAAPVAEAVKAVAALKSETATGSNAP